MSTQEITSTSRSAETADRCRRCGAALADDQRYCLECGEPRAPARSALLGGTAAAASPASAPAKPPFPPSEPGARVPGRSGAVVLLAGVGVLLLAMGVGVLIGRSVAPSSSAGPAEVITVGSSAGNGASATGTGAGEFSDDWPAAKSGYTVLLQSLPQATTTTTAVTQAKSAATAKGAPAVGALKTADFASLTPGSYDVYSGEFSTRAQAEKALAKLGKSFPGASVIKVSARNGGSGTHAAGESSSGAGSSGGGGSSSAPGSSSQLQKLSKTKGKNYEQESKNLPNEVGT